MLVCTTMVLASGMASAPAPLCSDGKGKERSTFTGMLVNMDAKAEVKVHIVLMELMQDAVEALG